MSRQRYRATNKSGMFKKKAALACTEKFKNLGHLVRNRKLYELPKVTPALNDSTSNPFEIEKAGLSEAHQW